MHIHRDFNYLSNIKNAVVTTGSFDGVHVGHKVIIKRLNELARSINGESVLITFHPHPRLVLYPDDEGRNLKLINSQQEKIALLEKTGLNHLIIVNFTLEFSKTSSNDFVIDYLVGQLHAKIIIVGFNHHFGFNREGDYSFLFKLAPKRGFKVEEIPEQDIQNEVVSSTKIRKALTKGNIRRANAYLDHFYLIQGHVRTGNPIFETHGYKTAAIEISEKTKLLPPRGVYALSLELENKHLKAMGIIYSDKYEHCEIHFIQNNPEANSSIEIFFHKKIHPLDTDIHSNKIVDVLKECKMKIEELVY